MGKWEFKKKSVTKKIINMYIQRLLYIFKIKTASQKTGKAEGRREGGRREKKG